MFKSILFYFDHDGKPYESPLELKASDCNSTHFNIWNGSTTRVDGININLPSLQISRSGFADSAKKLKQDPYNEDGKPPTVLFGIIHPHVEIVGDCIQVVGWEDPNLSWAGVLKQPYSMCPKKRGVKYLPEELEDEMSLRDFHELNRQAIMIK